MKVHIFPPTSSPNKYIENVINGLEDNGVEVVNKGNNSKFQRMTSMFWAYFKGTDVYHFNWIENYAVKNTVPNRIFCGVVIYWIKFLKRKNKLIVWTMHNKEAHDIHGDRTLYNSFMHSFIPLVDLIFVHAREIVKELADNYNIDSNKIVCVPHGSYLSKNSIKPVQEDHDEFTFLAFGIVNKYKNIPILIEAFNRANLKSAKLLICGKCSDESLKEQINSMILNDRRIEFDDRYIPDEEVDEIFQMSDVVVLPYDKKSMINSGAAVMAFSQAKPIIVSNFGAIKDIEDREFIYSYDYENEEQHLEQLKCIMVQVYNSWAANPNLIQKQGEYAFKYALNELSWDVITRQMVDAYREKVIGDL